MIEQQRRIVIVISSMSAAGAERAAALLANTWAAQMWAVTIITFEAPGTQSFYRLDERISRKYLSFGSMPVGRNRLQANIARMKAIRKALRETSPDIVVASMDQTNVLTVLAARPLGIPTVVVEQVDPTNYSIGPLWGLARLYAYSLAAAVVGVSNGVRNYFPCWLRSKITVIPNPLDTVFVGAAGRRTGGEGRRVVVAMGRLTEQKGFDLLIEAFDRVHQKNGQWDLQIWGAGPLRDALEKDIERRGLRERIRLCGLTDDAAGTLAGADLFVMSSRWEGFPLVLGEAMLSGIPVISFDCPSGPGEMIEDGRNGVLVPPEDTGALATALDGLMNDPELRDRVARRAPDIADRFGVVPVAAAWGRLIDNILECDNEHHG